MNARHWIVWLLGWCATVAMLLGIPFLKGGPDWYGPVFLAAAGYCVAGRVASVYFRRTKRAVPAREAWVRALSSARVGFLAVVAVAAVLGAVVVIGLVAK